MQIFAAASALDDLWDEADVVVVRSLSAQSALALVQTEQTARPWYLDAQTPIQTASYWLRSADRHLLPDV